MIRWLILVIALLPSAYLSYLATDAPHLGRYHDDGLYWTAGRSIAEGNGYRIASLPGQPHQTKYPPVYPLLLSVVWKVFPTGSVAAAVWLNWLFVPAFALTAYLVATDFGLGQNSRLAVAAAVALQPLTALIGIHFLADLPFACLALLSLAAAKRSMDSGSSLGAFGAGVLAGVAYLIKTAGLPLLIIPPILAWRRTFRSAAAALAPLLTAIAAWHVWAHTHRSGAFLYYTDYLGYYLADLHIGDLTRILVRNLAQYVQAAGSLIVFNLFGGWQQIICILAGMLAIGAVGRAFCRRSAAVYAAFSAAYSLMLLGWNFPPTERFLLPLMPMFIAALLCGLKRFPVRITAAAIIAGVAATIAASAFALEFPAFVAYHRILKRDRDEAFAWMRANTPPNAQVFTHYDSCFYMATSHSAARVEPGPVTYYRGGNGAAWGFRELPSAARNRETYAIETVGDLWRADATDAERAAALSFLRTSPAFRTVYRNRTVTIYRVSAD